MVTGFPPPALSDYTSFFRQVRCIHKHTVETCGKNEKTSVIQPLQQPAARHAVGGQLCLLQKEEEQDIQALWGGGKADSIVVGSALPS